jgi:hypothetical protein
MPLTLCPTSKVFIACPATSVTGGPELLHQLCAKLRRRGVRAFMHYYPTQAPEGHYAEYAAPRAAEIEDDQDNVLVLPEVAGAVRMLLKYSRIRRALWWLSVDNYLRALGSSGIRSKANFMLGLEELKGLDVTHLAQSRYAELFLQENEFGRIERLSDYLNRCFIESSGTPSVRRDQVVYNPKKGVAFTLDLKARARDIAFVPLEKMTPAEVARTLRESKVYIDFGKHPGKDRIPREAAISGCCVITGRAGAAANPEDVPIPEEYKFAAERERIPEILARILECLANFEACSAEFKPYRQKIRGEEGEFEADVQRIFGLAEAVLDKRLDS